MICEVSYKVGEGGSWADGMPVEVRASGVYVIANDFTAWLAGTEPAGIATLPIPKRTQYRNWAQSMQLLTSGSFDLAAVVASSGMEEEDVVRMRVDALAQRDKIDACGGCDTTWGLEELRRSSVMIADLDLLQIEGITNNVEALAAGSLRSTMQHRRAYLIPYKTLLSSGSVTAIETPEITVVPERAETPFTFAQLVSEL